MGVQVSLQDLTTDAASSTTPINENNAAIEDAFNRCLDLTDNVNNSVQTQLDMGLNRIINVAPPVDDNDGSTKDYVDTAIADAVSGGLGVGVFAQLTGDVMTGPLEGIPPTAASHLTRKDYVDNAVAPKPWVQKWGPGSSDVVANSWGEGEYLISIGTNPGGRMVTLTIANFTPTTGAGQECFSFSTANYFDNNGPDKSIVAGDINNFQGYTYNGAVDLWVTEPILEIWKQE